MSVESCYVAVDWSKFQSLAQDSDLFQSLVAVHEDEDDDTADAEESTTLGGPAGSRVVYFGRQEDLDYYFDSWRLIMEFSDWLRPLRARLDRQVIDPFASVFMDMGLLFDDTFATAAIRQGTEFADTWMVAAISPQSVKDLCGRAQALDRSALAREFDKALSLEPSDVFPNGQFFVKWLDALHAGLQKLARRGEGLVIGAA